MVVLRKRLIFWLIKAYIKKSKKILIFSFLTGFLIFLGILLGGKYIKAVFSLKRQPVIGIVGSYEKNNLPDFIENKLSKGLTQIRPDGTIQTDLAERYTIANNGKNYTFTLKRDLKFSDGSNFESKNLNYNFSDVQIETPEKDIIIFKLKDSYTPFLVTVARPVFKSGYIGVGDYYIKDLDLNGNFVQNLTLGDKKNRFKTIKYVFYPTERALKTAFALGEVTQAMGVSNNKFLTTSFEKFPKTTIQKSTNYTKLVTLFYNTADSALSDRKVRLGLNYALPSDLNLGYNATLPFAPTSVYFNKQIDEREQDLDHAKLLLPESTPELTISTLQKYLETAKLISDEFKKVGIKTKIVEVDAVPDRFQIFLGDFNVPNDPDQYPLWHSGQPSNITRYKDLRIDKLLEDGRKTQKVEDRIKIYDDFQKFLIEDMPASFLYFPYEYSITRN